MSELAVKRDRWTPTWCRFCGERVDDLGALLGKTSCFECEVPRAALANSTKGEDEDGPTYS